MPSSPNYGLLVLLIAHVYCDDFYRCPASFKGATGEKRLFGDRCYLFVPTEVTGDSAFKRCQSMPGGQPVEILNEDTQNFLVTTIRSLDTWKDKNGIWIGFTDNSHWTGTGIWTWLASGTKADKREGYPDAYMNWADGEPAGGLWNLEDFTDDCATLRRGDNYKWRDRHCKIPTHFYICQFNMGPRTTTTTTTTTTTRPPPTKRPTTTPSTTSTTLKTTTTTTVLLTDKVHLGGSQTSNPTITQSDEKWVLYAAEAAKVKDAEGRSGKTGKESGNAATGLGIGIGLGILVVLAIVLIVFVCRRRRRKQANEEQVVSFHNNQYSDQMMDAHVYSDVNVTEYTEMGGAEAPPPASPGHNTYSNCSLLSGDTSANKKNEVAELARHEHEYAVPQVNQYAVPNTPPPTYFPPGLPPSYDEAAEGETVEDATSVTPMTSVTPGPLEVVRNDLYEGAEPSGDESEARTPVLVTNQLYGIS